MITGESSSAMDVSESFLRIEKVYRRQSSGCPFLCARALAAISNGESLLRRKINSLTFGKTMVLKSSSKIIRTRMSKFVGSSVKHTRESGQVFTFTLTALYAARYRTCSGGSMDFGPPDEVDEVEWLLTPLSLSIGISLLCISCLCCQRANSFSTLTWILFCSSSSIFKLESSASCTLTLVLRASREVSSGYERFFESGCAIAYCYLFMCSYLNSAYSCTCFLIMLFSLS